MKEMLIFLCLVFLVGCSCPAPESGTDNEATRVITEQEARQLATDYVNTNFKGHVWKTSIGDRPFQKMSPEDWALVKIETTTILVIRSGRNGQEFRVSMNLNGSNIEVLNHAFATL